ncbi:MULTISPECIES: hypothetical protein [Rhodococcus]|uniref:hypothetical protein n=1 Tax=Rhodococcus TaxID=1827 RepID=UPI0002FC5D00|nr:MULTISPECIES: hypothetical protein [Rhodococcus]
MAALDGGLAARDRSRSARCRVLRPRHVRHAHHGGPRRRHPLARSPGRPLDDLTALAAHADEPEDLLAVLNNRQRVPGNYTTKPEAVASAARSLTELGCTTSADLRDDEAQRNALVGVPGFGPATWECLATQLGIRTAESHRVVCEFLGEALHLEAPPSTADAEHLVAAAAARLEITPTAFTHAVWRYQRAQRRASGAR